MNVGDRVRLTPAGEDVALRCDTAGQAGRGFDAKVLAFGVGEDTGLVSVMRDGATRAETWALKFWEVVR